MGVEDMAVDAASVELGVIDTKIEERINTARVLYAIREFIDCFMVRRDCVLK
jgi:hypothetical protein